MKKKNEKLEEKNQELKTILSFRYEDVGYTLQIYSEKQKAEINIGNFLDANKKKPIKKKGISKEAMERLYPKNLKTKPESKEERENKFTEKLIEIYKDEHYEETNYKNITILYSFWDKMENKVNLFLNFNEFILILMFFEKYYCLSKI